MILPRLLLSTKVTDSFFRFEFRLSVKSHMWIHYSTCNLRLLALAAVWRDSHLVHCCIKLSHVQTIWTNTHCRRQPTCNKIILTGFPCKCICLWPAHHKTLSLFNHSNWLIYEFWSWNISAHKDVSMTFSRPSFSTNQCFKIMQVFS